MCETCNVERRVELHAHTDYSNIRLIDSINSVEELIKKASELGLHGIAITDHEVLSAHVKAIQIVRKYKEKGKLPKDFKLILGNEIYLVDSLEEVRDNYQSGVTKFPHFLLISKNKKGHEALRKLSSMAWENSFYTGTMERVPTIKENLEKIAKEYEGCLIGGSACLGSESSIHILEADKARKEGNVEKQKYHTQKLYEFIEWNIDVFGKDDFYLELQPATSEEQIIVNKALVKLSEKYGLKMIVTNDVHYLRPEDRDIHEAYLKSKEEERETAEFYASTYLHKIDEIYKKMNYLDENIIKQAIENTIEIANKVEDYTIEEDTVIPVTRLPEFEVKHIFKKGYDKYLFISKMANSEHEQDRYLLHLIEEGFLEHIYNKALSKEYFHQVLERIDVELQQLWEISEKLNQRMTSYYVTVAKIVDLIWGDDCGDDSRYVGSLLGAGRGSAVAFLINYLIGVTQVNPLAYGIEVPYWRHLHKSRADISALDIDLDIVSTRKKYVFERLRNFYGDKKVIQVCTFGTEKSKSAIQTACRGLGIDNDTALYISSLIPSSRGNLWSLKDCLYGNEEEGREPIKQFINEIEKYPRLKETALKIEGLINKRSIHAGGLLVLNEDYDVVNAMMRAPNGAPITQFNLDDSQSMGAIKFDLLVIEANDKIQETIELLLEYGEIEWQGTLRKTFEKYFHPEIIDKETPELFKIIGEDRVLDLFQFSTSLGQQMVKKVKPKNLIELVSINSLMRLMTDSEEQPIDTFIRYRDDIDLWYQEMKEYGLTEEEQTIFEKYLKALNGVADTQEAVMLMAMDEGIAGFTVKEANFLRKSIAKKNKEVQDEVKEMLYEWGLKRGNRKEVVDYLWLQISRQLGYAFSVPHVLAYTLIAMIEVNLNYYYSPLYWLTACLTVNSGSQEVDEDEKKKSTDYGKIAEAIGKMRERDVAIAHPNINKANFGFSPDIENEQIIFGLKGINGIGDDVAHAIIENRPYSSFDDFYEKMYKTEIVKKSQFIMLIKAGAFNEFGSPIEIMKRFLVKEIDVKETLNMQNIKSILKYGLLDTPELSKYKELYYFRQYIMKRVARVEKIPNPRAKKGYSEDKILGLDTKATEFFNKMFDSKAVVGYNNNGLEVSEKEFDKQYQKLIEPLKEIIASKEFVNKFNQAQFIELWTQYAQGSVEKWEMEALSYYSDKHELDGVDFDLYGISNFFELPTQPEVEKTYINKNGQERNIYKIYTIVGTVLDRNKTRHTISLLTPHGVVTCKTYSGAFAHYDKTISKSVNGKKKTVEKSWFTRGNLLLMNGYRVDDQFILKTYKNKGQNNHTINLIKEVEEDGKLILQAERARV